MAARATTSQRPRSQPSTVDSEEAALMAIVAQLTLEDVTALGGREKGKSRHDAPKTDAALALELLAEDARTLGLFERDRALAQSLQEAEERGGSLSLLPASSSPSSASVPNVARPTLQRQPTQPRPAIQPRPAQNQRLVVSSLCLP
jgi:hypothetical protein